MRTPRLLTACLLVFSAGPAFGQISWQPNFNLAPTMMQAQVLNPCPDGVCGDQPAQRDRRNRSGRAASAPTPAVSVAKLQFMTSIQRRQKNISGFIEKVRAADPAGADQLAATLASTDVIGLVGNAMRGVGLRPDNVADAFAVYWSSAWHGSVGSNETPSRAQFARMKTQATLYLQSSPEIMNASDALKQEFAESLLIQAAMIDAALEEAQGNRQQLADISRAVTKGAMAMGLDLEKMTLTENGFVWTKKQLGQQSEAKGSVLAAAPLADSPPPAETSTNRYYLIAAAGGAGFAGMFLLGRAFGKRN